MHGMNVRVQIQPGKVEEACGIASLDEPDAENKLIIFPNPAQDELNISFEGYTIEEIAIYTLTGQQILKAKPANGTIDISHLQPGMYFVEVTIENTKVRQKLLVQR